MDKELGFHEVTRVGPHAGIRVFVRRGTRELLLSTHARVHKDKVMGLHSGTVATRRVKRTRNATHLASTLSLDFSL